jgi:nucleoside-diphosphate-sugar epimerase
MRQQKTMGFLDVEDAVSAIMAVADKPAETWKPVYNVGNGRGYTVEEIYETAAQLLKDRMTVNDPVYENGNDASCTAVSYELLNADTGFVPVIDLKTSTERIIRQMQANAEGIRI